MPRLRASAFAAPDLAGLERPRINRAPSPVIAAMLPVALVVLGSLSPTWPVIASAPVLPPLGLMFLIGWLQLRPGLIPVWAGFPLGLVDDCFSGQPLGSAVVLWSVVTLVLDLLEARFPWRGFWQDWMVAAATIVGCLLAMAWAAGAFADGLSPLVLAPQIAVSVLLYPLAARVVGLVDRVRLIRFRVV